MSKTLIQILYVQKVAGRSKKTGNDYDMRMAQCIVHKTDKDGQVIPLVGELVLPEKFKDIAPGSYEADFEVAIDQQKRVGSVVSELTPVRAAVNRADQKVAA
ncbi:hypothetical protein [Collimonas antrihumi]|uniref:hypothetical protein n=1 Tax=Collimonas antrihumi TaxID=1940615 RepID=UPI001B8CA342|nr:hypothetical protein [Collimonas antrihumi]